MSGENRRSLRVSDTDRDKVAVALREHAVAGRLTLDEFSERIDRAYAARTEALEAVTSDLPELFGRPPASRREPKRFLGVVFGGGERRAAGVSAGASSASRCSAAPTWTYGRRRATVL